MIEFALALPLFLFILLGVVDLGRVMIMWTGVANGAREGARIASLAGSTGSAAKSDSEIRQAVANLVPGVSAPEFSQTNHIAIVCRDTAGSTATCTSRDYGWTVEVIVAYPFGPLPPFSAPLGAFSSFGVSPFTPSQCTSSYTFNGRTFSNMGGEAGCIMLTADARGPVE